MAGHLAILLHAHLPYIPRPDGAELTWEEKWLFEALTESYLPLIRSWERLAQEGIVFKLTLSLSPTLLSMLIDPRIQERYGLFLAKMIDLAERERERISQDCRFSPIVEFYFNRLKELEMTFKEIYRGDLVTPLKKLQARGNLEIITTCATHGYLPLILTPEAQRAQVKIAVDFFEEIMGWKPAGFWLPECGYVPGIERILKEAGINYFIVAAHGLLNAHPRPKAAVYAPVRVGGLAAFGRDWETSHQVWSRTEGYPGDPVYREFYRDIGYDLDFEYLAPYLLGGIRGDTGFKYYRITGSTERKEPYDYQAARLKVREHAYDFMGKRAQQVLYWTGRMEGEPVIVAPYDAELFGHWWFEGPDWLEEVLRLAASSDYQVQLTTLSEYLDKYPPREEVNLGFSSWGEGGYNQMWLNPTNDWIYPLLHQAEKAMQAMVQKTRDPSPLEERVLRQAARELLLAQSSDWPFILTTKTVVEYAQGRLKTHLQNFFRLYQGYQQGGLEEDFLTSLEAREGLFPNLDYSLYQREAKKEIGQGGVSVVDKPVIFMLAWEFPPQHVGGLGIHVRDLSLALAREEVEVHVLTLATGEKASSIVYEGVEIHYVPRYQGPGQGVDFLYWVLQFNLALADKGYELFYRLSPRKAILHAHDWLVASAAQELKRAFGAPLIATIHATEYGRNQGLHNPLQEIIHRMEGELVAEAQKVICCSQYMAKEVEELFHPPLGKVRVIPNGVRPINIMREGERGSVVLYVGRLVVEKGVQVLLRAFARLLTLFPEARLVVAGAGPYASELKHLAAVLNIAERVEFTGFVSETRRNELLGQSYVAVFPSLYEPFGIVALEAMAAGVPVIVSRTGGLAEIVEDGITGLSFTPGDVEDLLRCLVFILQNPAKAEEFSRQARAKVERDYTWEVVARHTVEVYEEIGKEK